MWCSAGSPASRSPDVIVNVVDATNLRLGLRLSLELMQLGRPMIVALNMSDIARKRGMNVDPQHLAAMLGCAGGRDRGGAVRRRARSCWPRWRDAQAGDAGAVPRLERADARARSRRRSARCAASSTTLGYREPLRSRAAGAASTAS